MTKHASTTPEGYYMGPQDLGQITAVLQYKYYVAVFVLQISSNYNLLLSFESWNEIEQK